MADGAIRMCHKRTDTSGLADASGTATPDSHRVATHRFYERSFIV